MKTTLAALIALLTLAPAAAQTPDISGKWDVSINTAQGSMPATLAIIKEGDKLSGTLSSQQGDLPAAITLKDKAVSISVTVQNPQGTFNIAMAGTVEGDTMKGTVDFGGRSSSDWSAKRAAGSAVPPAPQPTQDKPAPTLTGAWQLEVQHSAGVSTPTVTMTQTGEKLAGKYSGTYGESELTGSIKGTEFTFTVEIGAEQKVKVVYTGTLSGDAIKGNVSMGELGEGTFSGKRK